MKISFSSPTDGTSAIYVGGACALHAQVGDSGLRSTVLTETSAATGLAAITAATAQRLGEITTYPALGRSVLVDIPEWAKIVTITLSDVEVDGTGAMYLATYSTENGSPSQGGTITRSGASGASSLWPGGQATVANGTYYSFPTCGTIVLHRTKFLNSPTPPDGFYLTSRLTSIGGAFNYTSTGAVFNGDFPVIGMYISVSGTTNMVGGTINVLSRG